MSRPLTSRSRKKIEQLEDDQQLARVIAFEEDQKIARKLQRDYENGLEVDDFHRIDPSLRDEFAFPEEMLEVLFGDPPKINIDIPWTDITQESSPANQTNRSGYESQRASFKSNPTDNIAATEQVILVLN